MNARTTWRLLAAVCAAGCLLWLSEQGARERQRRRARGQALVPLAPREATRLAVERKGEFRFEVERAGGSWRLTWPLEARADRAAVERILDVLHELRRGEIIGEKQRRARDLTLADYGLVEPRARFEVSDGSRRVNLSLGRDAPLGDAVYVRVDGGSDVVAVSRRLFEVVPQRYDDVRDRRLFRGDPVAAVRLEIQRPGAGFLQFMRYGRQWAVLQPLTDQADRARMAHLLDVLFAARVARFVWDPVRQGAAGVEPATGPAADPEAHLVPFGLTEEAAARVRVWVSGDTVGQQLVLGKTVDEEGGEVFARIDDGSSICAVGREVLETCATPLEALRERKVFDVAPEAVTRIALTRGDSRLVLQRNDADGWQVLEPIQWKADDVLVAEFLRGAASLEVESFLHEPGTNLAALGLAPPAMTLDLRVGAAGREKRAAPGEGRAPAAAWRRGGALLLGRVGGEGQPRPARFERGGTPFTLPAGFLRGLGQDPSDPLVFRDRTMLAVPREDVVRLALKRAGSIESVRRNDEGQWVPAREGGAQTVRSNAVEDVLFHVANLRALRVEAHNPENPGAYGLADPAVTLTLGLRQEQGIQKSVLLGFRSRTDAIYAMVQGHDTVFSLDRGVADELSRGLLGPPASAPAP